MSTSIDHFIQAAERGDVSTLREMLAQSPALAREFSTHGFSALHAACYWGRVDATRVLIKSGADVNALTRDSFLQISPLGAAVATPDQPNPSDDEAVVLQLVDLLLDAGANVNIRRRDGMTALHSAAYRGLLAVIRRLVERGVDVTLRANADAGSHANQSARDTALAQGQAAAAQLLASLATPRAS